MKKLIIALCCILFFCVGCNSHKVELESGNYYLSTTEKENDERVMSLDCENNTFVLYLAEPTSSYRISGSFEIKEQKLIATTDDDEYRYVFDITNKNEISFSENESQQREVQSLVLEDSTCLIKR